MLINSLFLKKPTALSCKKLVLITAGTGLLLLSSLASAGDFDPAKVKWSQLSFRTYVLFFTLEATVNLQKLTPAEAKSALLQVPDHNGVPPNQDFIYLLNSHTAKFGRDSSLKLWFEGDLTPLQRTEIETGRKNIVRTYRFLPDGVYRRDLTPTETEKHKQPDQWTNHSTQNYSYPADMPPLKMTDNSAIFYAVSAASLVKKGDSVVFLTFDKKHINEVKLLCQGFADIEVDYTEQSDSGNRHVYGNVKALRVSLQSKPLGKDIDNKDFMFLGVKGDISIYLDPQYHIPLRVSGKADYVGHTDINLTHVNISQ